MIRRRHTLVLPAALLVGAGFVYPVIWRLIRSVTVPGLGFQNHVAIFEKAICPNVLRNTVAITGATTALCVPVGFPVAWSMVHAWPWMRRVLLFAVLIPVRSSILVRSFAWPVISFFSTQFLSFPLRGSSCSSTRR